MSKARRNKKLQKKLQQLTTGMSRTTAAAFELLDVSQRLVVAILAVVKAINSLAATIREKEKT